MNEIDNRRLVIIGNGMCNGLAVVPVPSSGVKTKDVHTNHIWTFIFKLVMLK